MTDTKVEKWFTQHEPQRPKLDAEKLFNVLEEVLVQHIATCELRDYYRKKAGLPGKCT